MPGPDIPRQLHYFFMNFKKNSLEIKEDLYLHTYATFHFLVKEFAGDRFRQKKCQISDT